MMIASDCLESRIPESLDDMRIRQTADRPGTCEMDVTSGGILYLQQSLNESQSSGCNDNHPMTVSTRVSVTRTFGVVIVLATV